MDQPDTDPQETREWLDALEGVLEREGPERAHFLIEELIGRARRAGAYVPFSANTDYINTIPVEQQPHFPGDFALEQRIRHYVRWNAMAMVVRANKHTDVGGHISSFASAATLYDVGYNHFWRAADGPAAATWSSSRATPPPASTRAPSSSAASPRSSSTTSARRCDGRGLSSYPHPWLMPDFWQFPTVSMGLGPIMSIYQARFMRLPAGPRHRRHRGPEGVGVLRRRRDGRARVDWARIALAGREKLDNLIFVVNCNLQRLDGPVRGNGKIIQELESRLPRRRLERHQGDLGQPLGPAPREGQGRARCAAG